MKNVISFDVGMKNLAYCLFQVGDNDTNNIDNINNINFLNRLAFIFGSEDEGINELVKKNSDRLIKIPIQSSLNSLNVSNAVASALTYYRLCK